jgi:hypothetical protein
MEIKIGVRQATRELVIETDETTAEVSAKVTEALTADGILTLTDTKGRQVIVPASALAYVETGDERQHPVGFGVV